MLALFNQLLHAMRRRCAGIDGPKTCYTRPWWA